MQLRVTQTHERVRGLISESAFFFDTPVGKCDGPWVHINNQKLLMLASYNYFGFTLDADILSASAEAMRNYGVGQHGSRLVSGTTVEHKQLEAELASFMSSEDAIVFGSGYVTNLATIAALVGPEDLVIGDQWNHACLVDGCRLSGASFKVFRHNDLEDLERLLKQSIPGRTLVAVDAVYSMEGDIAPLPEIARLCRRYGSMLMVDEAHSLGTLGATGRGIQEYFGLEPDMIDIKMGTLSKSLGAYGGFIAGKQELVDFLRLNARGYIFSGALPPTMVAAARKALGKLATQPTIASELRARTERYRAELEAEGLKIYGEGTQIVPLACKNEDHAIGLTKRLRELGLYVIPIIYPAVPADKPRIRTNLTLLHQDQDIDFAVKALIKAFARN